LRILHITPYWADAWAYGGIARLAATLARGLARRGHHVTVCTTDVRDRSDRLPRSDPAARRFTAWPAIRTAEGIELRVFPNLSNRLAYHFQAFVPFGLERYMRHHAGTFDVAHLHACRNLLGVVAAYHLRRRGVPYVLAPNGTAPLIERRRLLKRGFDVVAGQRTLDSAARVLAVSEAERQQLNELGVRAGSISLIPNPVDLGEFTAPIERGRFRRRFALPEGPLVLFLGRLSPRKRLDVLIRAFALLTRPDAHLVIAGNDMGSEKNARSLARALGVERQTVFTGLLTGAARIEALADADVLVYPSEDEIFGLVPLEAILSGTPVIVADDSGCGEVIRKTGGGDVVPLGSPTDLAQAIVRVLVAPAESRAAAASAAVRIRATYGDEIVCAQLEQLYQDMVA
jgi:glycosyltransferase involved in cell wall biosynthesis